MLVLLGNFLIDSYYTWFNLMNKRNLLRLNVFFRPEAAALPLRILSRSLLHGIGLGAIYFALMKYALQFFLNSSMLSLSSGHI